MNKSPARLATAALLIAVVFPLYSQNRADITSAPFSNAPYRVGERLTYNISFAQFVSAAHAELEVVGTGKFEGRDGYHLHAHVKTAQLVAAALFQLDRDYDSYVDPLNGIPFHSEEADRGSIGAGSSEQPRLASPNVSVPEALNANEIGNVFDFLAAIYRFRALPLSDRARYSITTRTESQQYQAELRVVGKQLIKTNVGSFNTISTQIDVLKNAKAKDYRIQIFFSEDETHLPVVISLRQPSGTVRAELASVELPEAPSTSGAATPIPSPTPTPKPPASRPTPTPIPTTLPSDLPFAVGEDLNFDVFLGNSTERVGTASFQVRPRARYFNRDGVMFSAKAQTTGLVRSVFSAVDQISSYVDPSTLLPFRTELQLQEGKRIFNQTFTMDQNRGTALSADGKRIEVPIGTHDMISAMYALRSFNLELSKRQAISILVNLLPRTLFIMPITRETIEIRGQKIRSVMLSLTTDDQQSDKYLFRLWVSDDNRRLPLRLTANSEFGQVRAELAIIPIPPK